MKTHLRLTIFALACFQLVGCAELTRKTYQPRKGGTVKYTRDLFFTEQNRSKALETARDFCQPARMVLLAEDSKTEFTDHTTSRQRTDGNMTYGDSSQSQSSNVYIHFQCARSSARK